MKFRMGRVRMKLAIAVAALLVGLGAAEAGMRVYCRAKGAPYDGARTREVLESNRRAASGVLIPGGPRSGKDQFFLHPYYGWETKQDQAQLNELLALESAGIPDEDYVILVIGGSVAGLFTNPQVGGADRLAEEVAADSRFAAGKVRVFGQGRGAFKQPQQLYVLAWLFALGVHPDAVIDLDGFNELAIANQNLAYDVHPLFPSFTGWGPRLRSSLALASPEGVARVEQQRRTALLVAERGLALRCSWSAILGRWTLARSNAALAAWRAGSDELLASQWKSVDGARADVLGPAFAGGEDQALELAIRAWRESSLDIEALCRRRGIAYLHALQPTLLDAGSKPLTEQELATGNAIAAWRTAITRGYPRLREEGALLRARGFPFLDASMVFAGVGETLYYDPCHFNRAGNEILARTLARGFLELVER
ncbi:MAG: hypothetical protein ABI054_14195 [Planctomycetota bacterium]